MKKIITFLSAALFTLSSLAFTAAAQEYEPVTDPDIGMQMIRVFMAENNIPSRFVHTWTWSPHEGKEIAVSFTTMTSYNTYYPMFAEFYEENNFEVLVNHIRPDSTSNETYEIPEPEYLLGDVTEDGAIQIEDAQLALTAYTEALGGNEPPLTELQRKAADPNGDGALTVEDAQYILNYYTANTLGGNARSWVDIVVRGK